MTICLNCKWCDTYTPFTCKSPRLPPFVLSPVTGKSIIVTKTIAPPCKIINHGNCKYYEEK